MAMIGVSVVVASMGYVNSKANDIQDCINENYLVETENEANIVNNQENVYEEYLENIKRVKAEYNVQETIETKEELKNCLETTENIDKVLLSSKDEVILDYIIEKTNDELNKVVDYEQKLSEAMKSGVGDTGIELVKYENGDFEASKYIKNKDGIYGKLTLKDNAEENIRTWHKLGTWTSDQSCTEFGSRYTTYSFESGFEIAGKTIDIGHIGFRVHYDVSEKGLKLTKITDDGTKATFPGLSLKITKKDLNDKVATKPASNIDGTVIIENAGFKGITIGDYTFPSVASKNFKYNVWITLHDIGKDYCIISHSYTEYVDDLSLFSN